MIYIVKSLKLQLSKVNIMKIVKFPKLNKSRSFEITINPFSTNTNGFSQLLYLFISMALVKEFSGLAIIIFGRLVDDVRPVELTVNSNEKYRMSDMRRFSNLNLVSRLGLSAKRLAKVHIKL